MKTKIQLFLIPAALFTLQWGSRAYIDYIECSNASTKCDQEKLQYVLIFSVLIIGLFLLNQLFAFSTTFKRYANFNSLQHDLIDRDVKLILEKYVPDKLNFRVNILNFKKIWFSKIYLSDLFEKAFSDWKRVFLPVLYRNAFHYFYTYNMDNDIDKTMTLFKNQGLAADSLKNGTVFVDLSINNPESFGLTPKQIAKTKDIKFILSTPIFGLDFEKRRPGNKIIGVLSIDSKTHGYNDIVQKGKFTELVADVNKLSKLVSYYMEG